MSKAATIMQTSSERVERAQRIIEHLSLLQGDKLDHAFAIGHLLIEWEDLGLHDVLGHATQDAIIAEVGLKRATALSNKRLARKFDLAKFRHIGLGKLRLLAANYVDDPAKVVFDGVEVMDAAGGTTLCSVEDLSYRELQAILRAQKGAAKPKARSPQDVELAGAIQMAMTPVLASFGNSENELTAPEGPSPAPPSTEAQPKFEDAEPENEPIEPVRIEYLGLAKPKRKPKILTDPALIAATQVKAAVPPSATIQGSNTLSRPVRPRQLRAAGK